MVPRLPVTNSLRNDLVHFGVIVVMNLMIGYLTPPFGMVHVVISNVTGIPFKTMARGVMPFLPVLLLVLLVVTIFPSLFLPNWAFG